MASKSVYILDTLEALRSGELPCVYDKKTNTYVFPAVESKTSSGARTKWVIKASLQDKNGNVPILDDYLKQPVKQLSGLRGLLLVESSQEGGKVRDVHPTYVTKGKNAGKRNATNVITQTLRDALTLYNRKKKTSRHSDRDRARPPPMLVKTNGDTAKATITELDFDGLVAQPKLNGVRLVAYATTSDVVMYSRTGSTYPGLENIRGELTLVLKNTPYYLDGELYKHGKSLLWISGQSRKAMDDNLLEYHVFDCFDPAQPNLTTVERQSILDTLLANTYEHVKRVPNFLPTSFEELNTLKEQFLRDGYEGIILRRSTGLYEFSYNGSRSSDIIRIKPKFHDEFACVDFLEGKKGKDKGAIVWVCETPKDAKSPSARFHVVPKNMTYEMRYKLYSFLSKNGNFDRYLKGKPLTIEFDEYSKKTGIPLRAKAVTFRTYEGSVDPMQLVLSALDLKSAQR